MVTELAFEINGLQLVLIDKFMRIDIRPENQLEHPGTMKALKRQLKLIAKRPLEVETVLLSAAAMDYTGEDGAAAPQPEFLTRQAFSPDLAPMYQRTEQDSQAVVNHLVNLPVAFINRLQRQAELAQQIAEYAHSILLDCDEDMAEVIERGPDYQTQRAAVHLPVKHCRVWKSRR